MFLHSGASLHGHEYSNRPPSNLQSPTHLRGPLLRSAFSPPKQRARTDADGTTAPPPRQRPASDYIPRDPSPVVRFREPQDDPPPTPATHDEPISESELSDVTSSIDGALSAPAARRRRPRRMQRRSTTYYLAYPAPRIIGKTKVMQKVFLPRLLLQLQKISEDGRSRPVLEVFPASRIAGPVVAPRLAKRFPGIFGVKRHLGYDDIVLVRRDDSDPNADGADSENEESLEGRNLLAVYSPLKHSVEAEIVLDNGAVWVAKPLANGSYDFVHTDAEGNITTARWARRNVAAVTPTSVSTEASTPSAVATQARYTFSTLNPLTRRHPVMATLTPSTLDVQDTYTSVSASHARHPPITRVGRSLSVTSSSSFSHASPYSSSNTPSSGSTSNGENDSAIGIPPSPDREATERTVHQIDDATKMLISVSALWVALRSGWSHTYNSTGSSLESVASPATTTSRHRACSRRNTWTTRSSTPDAPRRSELSAVEVSRWSGAFKRHSLPTQPPCGTSPPPTPPPPAMSRASTPTSELSVGDARPLPRRATSTGAAFMQRRLRASSSSPAVVAPVREAGDAEAARHEHLPPQQVSAPPPTKTEETQARVRASGQKADKGAGTMTQRREAEQDGPARNGSGKKSGVRSRLSRWFHKLGSR